MFAGLAEDCTVIQAVGVDVPPAAPASTIGLQGAGLQEHGLGLGVAGVMAKLDW